MTAEEIAQANETLRDKSPREVMEWAIGQAGQGGSGAIVSTNFRLRAYKKTLVAHPIREVMREPRAPLRAVVICTWCADFRCKIVLPVYSLRTIRNAELILDAEAWMSVDLFPRNFVGANV